MYVCMVGGSSEAKEIAKNIANGVETHQGMF